MYAEVEGVTSAHLDPMGSGFALPFNWAKPRAERSGGPCPNKSRLAENWLFGTSRRARLWSCLIESPDKRGIGGGDGQEIWET